MRHSEKTPAPKDVLRAITLLEELNLKAFRRDLGLSVERAAAKAGVSARTWYRWEHNKRRTPWLLPMKRFCEEYAHPKKSV